MRYFLPAVVLLSLLFAAVAHATTDYPVEMRKIVPLYPSGDVRMNARQGNEVNAAILAPGVTKRSVVFNYYKKHLLPGGWTVDSEMNNSMMSVLHFVRGGDVFIVGLMDHKQPGREGIMINLTLESNKLNAHKKPNWSKEASGLAQQQPAAVASQSAPAGVHKEFHVNGDGTVTQASRNLLWQQSGDQAHRTWNQARPYCKDMHLAGHDNWRLPTKSELLSLVGHKGDKLSIAPGFSVAPEKYWARNEKAKGLTIAWAVDFYGPGAKASEQNKARKFLVRCVCDD